MTKELGGSPPLPNHLRCVRGPEQTKCGDRLAALEAVDTRIGELYAADDCSSVLAELDILERCYVGLVMRRDRGSELHRWTFAECETMTLALKIREMYR